MSMTDTRTYAERREGRRRWAAIRGGGILLFSGASVGLRVGWLPVFPVFAFALVLALMSLRQARGTASALQRPVEHVSLPQSWSSTMPLCAARNQWPSERAEGEVFGQLTCDASGWTWRPTDRAKRMGAIALFWANGNDLRATSEPLWGFTQRCHLTLAVGPRVLDLWVRGRAVDVRNAIATTGQSSA